MRLLYIKYGIRLALYLAFLIYLITIIDRMAPWQIAVFILFYIVITGSLVSGFMKERLKVKNDGDSAKS